MGIGRFLSGQGRDTVGEIVERLLDGEAVEGPFEFRLTKRDETEAIVEVMPSLIVRGEQPVGVQAITRDVTEARRMQESLRFYVSQVLKAQEGERLRIARELHDDTAQALTGLSRRLDMLVDTLPSNGEQVPQEIRGRLEELRDQSDTILEGVRRFSRALRPPVLDDLGLLPALKWLAMALEEQGIAANISVLGEQHRLAGRRGTGAIPHRSRGAEQRPEALGCVSGRAHGGLPRRRAGRDHRRQRRRV